MTFGGTDYVIRDHDRELYGARSRQMFATYFAKAPTDQEDPATVPIGSTDDTGATTADATTENSTIAEPIADATMRTQLKQDAVRRAFQASSIELPNEDPIGSKKYKDLRNRVVWNVALAMIQQRSGSSSIDGFIKKTGAEWGDKNFDRYFRNEGKAKKPLMDQGSVDAREERILDHVLSTMESFQTTEKQTFVPTSETGCKPLFVFNETGSGKSLLMSLGSADFPSGVSKSMWQFKSQRQDQKMQLRPGLRGRHKFSRQHTHSPLAGRCFEWRVVVDTRVYSHGGYRFQVYEVLADSETGLRKKTKIYYGDGPHDAWSAMYADQAPETRCDSGVKLCGFTEPAFLALLDVARMNLVTQAVFRTKGNKKLSELKERRLREFNALANESFYHCMLALNPEDPTEAFDQLQRNEKWQRKWNKDWTSQQVLKLPMVRGMVEAYHKPGRSRESKLNIMSMFAPHYALKVTMAAFHANEKAVCRARLYAADGGAGSEPVRVAHRRMRVDSQKLAYMRGWCRSSFAGKEGDPSSNDIQLEKIAARLYPEYCRMARKELPNKTPMSIPEFYIFLKTGGFVNQDEETCCCGGCCDGWLNIQEFQRFIQHPSNDMLLVKDRVKRLEEIKAFYNGPYRWEHLSPESEISTHCMHHALSTAHDCYNVKCEHQHQNTCSECNQWAVLIVEVRAELQSSYKIEMDSLSEGAMCARDDEDWDTVGINVALAANLKEKHSYQIQQLKVYDDEQGRYVGHVVRKHDSSRAKIDQLAAVTPKWVKLTIDYKQKVLSREHKQKQSNNFGKKGMSLFGLTGECQIPEDFTGELPKGFEREGDYAIFHVRVCADDADQDWWHSAQVFYTAIRLLQQALPWRVEGGFLSSDGAVNFKTLAFMIMLTRISEDTGFIIKEHTFPEAGDGKDRCDRDFAGVNHVIDGYMKQDGAVMVCADDICTALESQKNDDPTTCGHIVNCAQKIQRPTNAIKKARKKALNTKKFAALAGSTASPLSKENIYHYEFEYDPSGNFQGVRLWAYYEPKAVGKYITAQQLLACWSCDIPNMREYFPVVTAGTDIITGPQMKTDVKTEKGKAHTKQDKAAKRAKKAEKAATAEQEQAKAEAIAASYRTSFRCFSCDKAYMREKGRNLHSQGCQPPLTFEESKEATISKFDHTFDTLRGHSLGHSVSSCALVSLKELCLTSPNSTVKKLIENGPEFIESSVASALRGFVDELIFTMEEELPPLLAGWATKEACARPNVRYCDALVAHLKRDFDAPERINHIQISRRLKTLYRDPKMHLRPSQVQSWVSSEVLRRKKKVLLAAAQADAGKPEEEVLKDMVGEMIKQLEVEFKKSAKEDLRKEKEAAKGKAVADKAEAAFVKKVAREEAASIKKAAREKAATDRAEEKAARAEAASVEKAAREKETADRKAARERAAAEKQAAKDKETSEKEAARERVAAQRQAGKEKETAEKEAARGKEGGKRQKVIGKAVTKPVEPLVKRKQPGRLIGHEHCWVCDDEIPEAQYSHAKERCIDEERCKEAAKKKATQTRSRKRNNKYDD